jgi:uncharacterized protein YndB with AHSA1/START domain
MTVTNVDKDFERLTLTVTAEFAAPIERVWQLWADARQLEGWWGPPTFPATVVEHDLTPGGTVTYFMTGPEGGRYGGWWRITAVNPPKSLEFIDGFADEHGVPVEGMPTTTVQMMLTEHDGGTRMELRSTFDTREQMDQLIGMGAVEGMTAALSQIDALLSA